MAGQADEAWNGDERRDAATRNRVQFLPVIRLDSVLTAIGVIAAGIYAYGDFRADIALIKQGLSTQAEQSQHVRGEIREVKQEVRQQGELLRGIETKVNRARL
jgi:hypothetical protein